MKDNNWKISTNPLENPHGHEETEESKFRDTRTNENLVQALKYTESMKKDFTIICERFKEFAESEDEQLRVMIENHERYTSSIDKIYYDAWEELREFLKSFCSRWAETMGPSYVIQPGKNNREILIELWLKESFNNIYRRMGLLAEWYYSEFLTWKEYYLLANNMFRNLEETIERSNLENFYLDKSRDNSKIPGLS